MKLRFNNGPIFRRLPLVHPVSGLLLVLFLAWAVALGLGMHRDLRRLDRANRISRVILAMRQRLSDATSGGDADLSRSLPPGLVARLENREDLVRMAGQARTILAADTVALRNLDLAVRETGLALGHVHEGLLLQIEARLARERGALDRAVALETAADQARALSLTNQAQASALLTALQSRPQETMNQVAASSHRSDLLLGLATALFAFLLWLAWYSFRQQNRYLKGSRLVEEMLEAYSRRLEVMNAELEQVSLLKTQFLANTSHELLTPLNGIIGSLEVMEDCVDEQERSEFINQAHRSAERLLDLIHDLLDLCRLEEGNLALRLRGVESGPLLERTITSHRTTIQSRGLALLVVSPAEGWPRIQADPERLTRVLQHILSNAIKFTEVGSIRLTGRIERQGLPQLRIEVADTGVGIESKKLPEVFELFQQADGSNTRRFGGTGLGLTLCRHLVQGMGGQIGMESDGPGRGARAWFTVPLAGVAQPASTPSSRQSPDQLAA